MSKLTLSVNKSVISRAKRYARQTGISVSEIVETYLDTVTEPPALKKMPPILRSLKGSLKNADIEDYKRHLVKKYR
jgi:hypothetical protein